MVRDGEIGNGRAVRSLRTRCKRSRHIRRRRVSPDYAAAGPGFPAPWGTAYAQPGGGAAYTGPAMPPPRRVMPGPPNGMAPYAAPPPPWSQRPGPVYGTGGLY